MSVALAAENINLVYYVYNHTFKSPRPDEDELIGEGMIGLVKAAKAYDPQTGNKFSTLAYRTIRREMLKVLQVQNYPKRRGVTVSLQKPLTEKGWTLEDALPEENDAMEQVEAKVLVRKMLESLPERHRNVLMWYYGIDCEPMTMERIGERLGVSQQRATMIRKEAEEMLRKKYRHTL